MPIVHSSDPDFTWKQPLPAGVVLPGVIGSRNKARFERALSNYRHAIAGGNRRRASKWQRQLLRINRRAGYGQPAQAESMLLDVERFREHAQATGTSEFRSRPVDPDVVERLQAGVPTIVVDPLPDGDLLRRFANQAHAPFVIDKGKSYSPLKESLGSKAVELDLRNPVVIPPMPQGNQS